MSAERVRRAQQNFDALLAYKRDGVDRHIPETIQEIWAQRQWLDLGYGSYGEACAAILGPEWRMPWSVEQRQEVVAELAQEGMSTRAIADAIGVSHPTVISDIRSGGQDLPPVTGLDGKTYTRSGKRVTDPEESKALTARIVALREGSHPMDWANIGETVGLTKHAAQQRYAVYRSKHPRGEQVVAQLPTKERIAALSGTGMTSLQIAGELGLSHSRVREVARREGIVIAADANRGKGGIKTIDQQVAIGNWIVHLAALMDSADSFIDTDDLPPDKAAEWACQLDDLVHRLRVLTRAFRNQPSERQTHHG